jgi:hypothetical protein
LSVCSWRQKTILADAVGCIRAAIGRFVVRASVAPLKLRPAHGSEHRQNRVSKATDAAFMAISDGVEKIGAYNHPMERRRDSRETAGKVQGNLGGRA